MSIASAMLGEYSAPVRISWIAPQKGEVFTTWSLSSLVIMVAVLSRVRSRAAVGESLTKLRLPGNQGLAVRVWAEVRRGRTFDHILRELRMTILLLIIILILLFGGGGGYYGYRTYGGPGLGGVPGLIAVILLILLLLGGAGGHPPPPGPP